MPKELIVEKARAIRELKELLRRLEERTGSGDTMVMVSSIEDTHEFHKVNISIFKRAEKNTSG